ncbi:hypothetical protein T11_14318 [Trichinella zimbabwensis]|uniref:Uncharacterized protein n=1 Tax=Trichinella zimbabwensis TaxID=268475 RepID=A0A0V1GA61_9BILA|nr:hypothetical protein T11_14318 [Trichinella zimbabwensis]
MNGIDFEKLQNHNEPGRTLHGTSFVEIVAYTFNYNGIIFYAEISTNIPQAKRC